MGAPVTVTSRSLGIGATPPASTRTTAVIPIGTYKLVDGVLTVSNVRYGPIDHITACRNPFLASDDPDAYTVTVS